MYRHSYSKASWCPLSARDTTFFLMRWDYKINVTSTMVADVSLADKGDQESFGFSSSLALVNSSLMKGNQVTRRGSACSQGRSQPARGAGRDLLSNKFTTCLVSRLWWVVCFLLYGQSYNKASWCPLSARDTTFFVMHKSNVSLGLLCANRSQVMGGTNIYFREEMRTNEE
jgi:hypothetical protein